MFFKRKPVYVDFFTDNEEVFDLCRPHFANKSAPKWWQKLPKFFLLTNENGATYPSPTMKTCNGFVDLMRNCISVSLWSELAIKLGPEGAGGFAWQFSDQKTVLEEHNIAAQAGGFPPQAKYQHVKLHSPWHIVCKEDVKFMMFGSGWSSFELNNDITIPAGVLDFKMQHSLNINMFLRRKPEVKEGVFGFGEQLCLLLPVTERPVKLRYHLCKTEELPKRMHYPKFLGSHRFVSKLRNG